MRRPEARGQLRAEGSQTLPVQPKRPRDLRSGARCWPRSALGRASRLTVAQGKSRFVLPPEPIWGMPVKMGAKVVRPQARQRALHLWTERRYQNVDAILAFVTNFIPNIGFVLGVVPPAAFPRRRGPGRPRDPQPARG